MREGNCSDVCVQSEVEDLIGGMVEEEARNEEGDECKYAYAVILKKLKYGQSWKSTGLCHRESTSSDLNGVRAFVVIAACPPMLSPQHSCR